MRNESFGCTIEHHPNGSVTIHRDNGQTFTLDKDGSVRMTVKNFAP